jgi:hypothetical protein
LCQHSKRLAHHLDRPAFSTEDSAKRTRRLETHRCRCRRFRETSRSASLVLY